MAVRSWPLRHRAVRGETPRRLADPRLVARFTSTMSTTRDFFEKNLDPKGVYKHAILARYAPVFAQAAGTKPRKAVLLDGYAGAGRYDDGRPGSPLILARVAAKIQTVDTRCVFVEKDSATAASLRAALESDAAKNCQVVDGDIDHHLDAVVCSSRDAALLAFLDPFNKAPPFERIADTILNRDSQWPTEVLLHISLNTVRRIGGLVRNKSARGASVTLAGLDPFFGGDWWQASFLEALDEGSTPTEAAEHVAGEYGSRINGRCGCGCFTLDVRARPEAQPTYLLTLFSRHAYGFWRFNDAVSSAQSDWRAAYSEGQLFDHTPQPTDGELIEIIERNIKGLLAQGPFTPTDAMAKLYGDTLGIAREKHARRALVNLWKAGVIDGERPMSKGISTRAVRPAK